MNTHGNGECFCDHSDHTFSISHDTCWKWFIGWKTLPQSTAKKCESYKLIFAKPASKYQSFCRNYSPFAEFMHKLMFLVIDPLIRLTRSWSGGQLSMFWLEKLSLCSSVLRNVLKHSQHLYLDKEKCSSVLSQDILRRTQMERFQKLHTPLTFYIGHLFDAFVIEKGNSKYFTVTL